MDGAVVWTLTRRKYAALEIAAIQKEMF